MTTDNRMSRFDSDKVNSIQISGSIENPNMISDGILRTNVDSNDPFISLTSFPTNIIKFSNAKIEEVYDTEFAEFVDGTTSFATDNSFVDQSELGYLRNQLQQLTAELDAGGSVRVLSTEQKRIIIELRILLGQGTSEEDFSSAFPYLPLPEYLKLINSGLNLIAPTNNEIPTEFVGPVVQPTTNLIAPTNNEIPTEFVGPVIQPQTRIGLISPTNNEISTEFVGPVVQPQPETTTNSGIGYDSSNTEPVVISPPKRTPPFIPVFNPILGRPIIIEEESQR